jgi:hypothetical protein
VAAGRYAHRRSKQTQVPSGGTLLSQPAAGGAAAAATQRLGRHGSSHAQSLSTAHGAAAEAPPLDGADEVALGPGVGLAPGSGLAVALPGVAAPSAGVVAAVLVAGGVDGAGAGVELLQATIVTLATIVRLARNTGRFTARGVSPVPGPRHQSPRSRPRHDANARFSAPCDAQGRCAARSRPRRPAWLRRRSVHLYGTEQAFAGPERSERRFLDNFGGSTGAVVRAALPGPAIPARPRHTIPARRRCIEAQR